MCFFFSSRRRHTRCGRDWSSDVCSSDLAQIKDDGGTAAQNSELQLTSSGSLLSYEWHQLAPNKTSLKVAPDGEFLRQTVTEKPGEKRSEERRVGKEWRKRRGQKEVKEKE